METDMIERVAQAIWEACRDEGIKSAGREEYRIWKINDPHFSSSCEVPEFERDEYRMMARAAIAAMLGVKCGEFDYDKDDM